MNHQNPMYAPELIDSDQSAFDFICNHLLTQNDRSISTDENSPFDCLYRNPENGMKCAVGCLIPDDKYRENIEGLGVNDSIMITLLHDCMPNWIMTKHSINMLHDLQGIHDRGVVEGWEDEFFLVAEKYQLKVNF